MFLRWMVRQDDKGVDFGLWKKISPASLICPIDLHVARVANRFNLVHFKKTETLQVNWKTAVELTKYLRTLDPDDPVKYDFALFGLGSWKNSNDMTLIPHELVPAINHSMEIELPATGTHEQLREKLSVVINDLINHDFEKLVFHLYRIDVDEARMRAVLANKADENAGGLIADLIIERQLQKIKAKTMASQKPAAGSDQDRW